jgi:hypothetical protein
VTPVPDPEVVVLRYLDRMVAHDWEAVAECLHPDVVRVGPFGDVYTARGPYMEFLSSLLPTLIDYTLAVGRVVSRASLVMVQLTETMRLGGVMDTTREVLAVDTDAEGRITRLEIFIQRSGG